MGFLSRKKKNPEHAVVEETHPLEEELQGMEEAVPERRLDEYPDPEPAYREPEPVICSSQRVGGMSLTACGA